MDENLSGIDIASAIAKLREHPEIISAVASALSNTANAESSKSENSENTAFNNVAPSPFPVEKVSEIMTTLAPMLSSPVHNEITGSREDHRYALLCALRPYLSSDRRDMIDYVLKFGKIGDLLKKIK